jgi:hypothetical protein
MRFPSILAPALLFLVAMSPTADAQSQTKADVAVAPFTVEPDGDPALRVAADSCLDRLSRGLAVHSVAVARHAQLSEKSLGSVRPTPWAVIGRVSREKGMIAAELRLMEVATGEEMRSYFHSDKDPLVVANIGEAAAARIAVFVKERKDSPPGP